MVIQRWQSLLLLLAVIAMIAINFLPVASLPSQVSDPDSATIMYLTDAPVLMIVSILVAVLLFIAIFMFKDLRMQMRVTILSIVLLCVLAVAGIFVICHNAPGAEIVWFGATLILVCAVVFACAAYRFMRRDYHLLRSADRLR